MVFNLFLLSLVELVLANPTATPTALPASSKASSIVKESSLKTEEMLTLRSNLGRGSTGEKCKNITEKGPVAEMIENVVIEDFFDENVSLAFFTEKKNNVKSFEALRKLQLFFDMCKWA